MPVTADASRKEHTLWTLQRLTPGVGVSNLPVALRVPGRLRWWPLRAAVNHVVGRHPALRTAFPDHDGVPVRAVLPPDKIDLELDLVDVGEGRLFEALGAYAAQPFEVSKAPLLRAGHFVGAGGDVVCVVVHHLVFDATSEGVLVRELAALYEAFARGDATPAVLQGEVASYAEPPARPASLTYWRSNLSNVDRSALALRNAQPEPDEPTFAGARRSRALSAHAHAGLGRLARDLRVTDNMVALAAFCLLLARHGAGPDLVVGFPVDVRTPATRDRIGYHVNVLALRVTVDVSVGFDALVASTRDALLAALEHADTPFDEVMPELDRSGAGWRTPLFRHMFNFRPPVAGDLHVDGEPAQLLAIDKGLSRLDLEFAVFRAPQQTTVTAVYSTETHRADDVDAMLDRYDALLRSVAGDPNESLRHQTWWSRHDVSAVAAANDTACRTPWPSVLAAVAAQVDVSPDEPAIVAGATSTSYRGLWDEAAAIASVLRAHGVAAGAPVAVSLPRGPALAATTLAVWSLGAAYLPLDPEQPAERLAFQVGDSGARVAVTDRALPPAVAARCEHVVVTPVARPAETVPVSASVPVDSVAYMIYTSGSTGTPKGVELTHGNLANVVAHFVRALDVRRADAGLWLTTFAFDISALELYLPLVAGGRVVVAPDGARSDPGLLAELVERHDVGIIQATPTTWRLLLGASGSAVRGIRVLCGGEPMSPSLWAALVAAGCSAWNVYGPTETTIWSTAAPVDAPVDGSVSVGRPIANTTVFVCDEEGNELPPGLLGELCVAGAGVARGYHGRPDLTADRFRTRPGHGRHYRTGDLARWRHDGSLELVGRADRQVKLRAHRIELGEVETALEQHPEVAAAAVVLIGDPTSTGRLVAFVQGPAEDLVEDVWTHASTLLPRYAMPSEIRAMALPQTPNGKIDHAALSGIAQQSDRPGGPLADRSPAAPRGRFDGMLTSLWQELLGRPELGPDANFFLSGGHSLLAARLVSRITAVTGRSVSLSTLLDAPTPTALGRHLDLLAGMGTVRS
jgi:amino acid adenylation domain-containing protein